ncbi:MAG: hypothetical protein JRK53_08665 [Deltaproteobacteria bacterium]|nr:hypothetical protein [Deltaproteobacteria bacterium]
MLLAVILPGLVYAEDDACDMLFVQDAKAMTFESGRLTLKGANPNIIFFCDRPVRTAGHMTRDAFMTLVSEGEDSFADNPPNAAVSIFGAKGAVTEAVVTLNKRPVTKGGDMIFAVKLLEGDLPADGGPVMMFIDPIGRPLSPVSIAGVHRRHRRRAIRHAHW